MKPATPQAYEKKNKHAFNASVLKLLIGTTQIHGYIYTKNSTGKESGNLTNGSVYSISAETYNLCY